MSRVGSNRRGADGARVENLPGFTDLQILAEIQKMMTENTMWTWAIPRTDHIHVNVQRHCMLRKRKRRLVHCECRRCKNIRARTLVFSWAWIRNEMVRNSHVQAEWKMGSCRQGHDAQLQWSGRPVFFGSSALKPRKRKIVFTFLWCRRHSRIGSSHNHFRQSAQHLRSSSGHVRRSGLQDLWLFRSFREIFVAQRPWWCQQNCRQRTKRLGPWQGARKLAARLRTPIRKIFQIIINCSNCAPMWVSRRPWRRDSISRPSTMQNRTNWWGLMSRVHFTSRQRSIQSKWMGSVGIRRSVQLWV